MCDSSTLVTAADSGRRPFALEPVLARGEVPLCSASGESPRRVLVGRWPVCQHCPVCGAVLSPCVKPALVPEGSQVTRRKLSRFLRQCAWSCVFWGEAGSWFRAVFPHTPAPRHVMRNSEPSRVSVTWLRVLCLCVSGMVRRPGACPPFFSALSGLLADVGYWFPVQSDPVSFR